MLWVIIEPAHPEVAHSRRSGGDCPPPQVQVALRLACGAAGRVHFVEPNSPMRIEIIVSKMHDPAHRFPGSTDAGYCLEGGAAR
jgi:hypothetical protein